MYRINKLEKEILEILSVLSNPHVILSYHGARRTRRDFRGKPRRPMSPLSRVAIFQTQSQNFSVCSARRFYRPLR
jgi:hypothetical protein